MKILISLNSPGKQEHRGLKRATPVFLFPSGVSEDWPRIRLRGPLQKGLSSAGGSYITEVMIIRKPNGFFKKKKNSHTFSLSPLRAFLAVPTLHQAFYLFICFTRQGLPLPISVQHLANKTEHWPQRGTADTAKTPVMTQLWCMGTILIRLNKPKGDNLAERGNG